MKSQNIDKIRKLEDFIFKCPNCDSIRTNNSVIIDDYDWLHLEENKSPLYNYIDERDSYNDLHELNYEFINDGSIDEEFDTDKVFFKQEARLQGKKYAIAECARCKESFELDIDSIRKKRSTLTKDELNWLENYINFKRTIRRCIIQYKPVKTVFGIFFKNHWSPIPEKNIAEKDKLYFFPDKLFIDDTSPRSIDIKNIQKYISIPEAQMNLDWDDIYESVVKELKKNKLSNMRGLGYFMIQTVKHENLKGDLLYFEYDNSLKQKIL